MKPISKPVVNTQLKRMDSFQRTAEVFRYFLLSVEFWISPEGNIRQWLRANARLAVCMAAPTLIAFPVVTVALWELLSWVNALTAIVGKLIFLPILVLLVLISVTVVCRIIRVFKP